MIFGTVMLWESYSEIKTIKLSHSITVSNMDSLANITLLLLLLLFYVFYIFYVFLYFLCFLFLIMFFVLFLLLLSLRLFLLYLLFYLYSSALINGEGLQNIGRSITKFLNSMRGRWVVNLTQTLRFSPIAQQFSKLSHFSGDGW